MKARDERVASSRKQFEEIVSKVSEARRQLATQLAPIDELRQQFAVSQAASLGAVTELFQSFESATAPANKAMANSIAQMRKQSEAIEAYREQVSAVAEALKMPSMPGSYAHQIAEMQSLLASVSRSPEVLQELREAALASLGI